jgi:hypothetical protein
LAFNEHVKEFKMADGVACLAHVAAGLWGLPHSRRRRDKYLRQ